MKHMPPKYRQNSDVREEERFVSIQHTSRHKIFLPQAALLSQTSLLCPAVKREWWMKQRHKHTEYFQVIETGLFILSLKHCWIFSSEQVNIMFLLSRLGIFVF